MEVNNKMEQSQAILKAKMESEISDKRQREEFSTDLVKKSAGLLIQ